MMRRAGIALAVLAASLLLVLAIAVDAERRATPPSPAAFALVEASGLFDLFLSSSSRWLRHPSVTERAAALADAPDGLDADPAGLAILPTADDDVVRFAPVEER